MKPLHIALLVLAGALGGALVTTVLPRQPHQTPAPRMARVEAPAQAPEATAPPEPAVKAEDTKRPSPWEAPKPGRSHTRAVKSEPVQQAAVIRPAPAPVAAAQETASPAVVATPAEPAAPPVVPELPAATSNPPVRVEPEHATPPPPPPPPEPAKVTLNAGALLSVRLIDGLSAERNRAGDPFTASLDREVAANGFVIAERGARVEGRVTAADPGGRVQGVSTISVELLRLHTSDGQTVAIETDPFERRAQATHGQDAAKIGAGAAIGAAIGAIAGGGKGAAIGAGAGGAAGTGAVLATRGKPAVLPTETHLSFRLSAPVTIVERR